MQTPDQVRETLARLTKERGLRYTTLSGAIGRHPGYIQQFVKLGRPARLDQRDRQTIAAMLSVDEVLLGAPDSVASDDDLVQVSRLAVEASAGPGAVVDEEAAIGRFGFDRRWLRRITRARPEQLSLIRVKGDSMAPTLVDGDDAMIDHSQADPRALDGIYVLRRDDSLLIKRLALAPTSATLTISSDNPAYPTWRDCPLASIMVVGRMIWASRAYG